ncbi:hypothetical protein H8K33_08085 [Undibacterium amnicola]|uniref:Uncharacterized protein n=1 Tax=Undibacterium amnicola TaxID=1834038 RepID=A0ABR6XPN2_9BURK|nr:hypothetical protein [Undibacterium amnicola]MBC3831465.1 hypothetical protein [Undibacterium amnicola]
MKDKLAVVILGNRNSGKSTTWYELFGAQVRTGQNGRRLNLTKCHYMEDVFLVNGSPEERNEPIANNFAAHSARVVLCSTQYVTNNATLPWFINNGYELYVQWLNPGYHDSSKYRDTLNLIDYLVDAGATVKMQNGKLHVADRVKELRQFIFGWASGRNLINLEF